jgi:adenosine deaminase
MDILSFIEKSPKAELHSHIDGGLRVQTIIDLAKKHDVSLPDYDYHTLKPKLQIDKSCKSLVEYFKPFEYTINVMQTEDALERVMYEFLEDSSNQNTKYIEARFSPALHLKKGLSLNKVMDALIRGKKQAEKAFNIKSNIIVCGLRQNPDQANKELAQLAVDYKNKGVAAFDLAGEELGRPAKNHVAAFEIAIKNNLFRTVHAGEADGAHSIADSIHFLGAHRIGHGTHLYEDNDLLNYVIDRQIALEVCLTSNMQTKSVANLNNHPLPTYFAKNVPVTINTDSTLISATTITHELVLAYELFNFSPADLSKIILNGFEHAFLPYDIKQDLLSAAKTEINELLKH